MQRLSGYEWTSGIFHGALVSAHTRLGAFEDAHRALDAWEREGVGGRRLAWLLRQYVRAQEGKHETVRAEFAAHERRLGTPAVMLGAGVWCSMVVEIAALLGEPAWAEGPTEVLSLLRQRGQVFTTSLVFHIPRVLGVAARLRGDLDEAVALLELAVAETEAVGAHAEHALALAELGRVLVERGDGSQRAFRLLSVARSDFFALGMQPAAAAASRSLESLADPALVRPGEAGSLDDRAGTLAIMFTDMVGSTPLTLRVGDLRARDVMRSFYELVRQQLALHEGMEVEVQGDGFVMAFGNTRNALACAAGIQDAVRRHNDAGQEEPLAVRVGVHTGEVVREGRKLFGIAVILASRIMAEARGGEILVSSAVRELARGSGGFRFEEERPVTLRGFPEPQTLSRLRRG